MWKYFLIALAVVLVLGVLIFFFATLKKDPYRSRDSMMSDAENYFYFLLKSVVPPQFEIIPQAPLIGVLDLVTNDVSARNKIIAKRFDYAVAVKKDIPEFPYARLITIAVIELDDSSHERKERIERDKFVEKVCSDHKITLLRYRCKSNDNPNYNVNKIKKDILDAAKNIYF